MMTTQVTFSMTAAQAQYIPSILAGYDDDYYPQEERDILEGARGLVDVSTGSGTLCPIVLAVLVKAARERATYCDLVRAESAAWDLNNWANDMERALSAHKA